MLFDVLGERVEQRRTIDGRGHGCGGSGKEIARPGSLSLCSGEARHVGIYATLLGAYLFKRAEHVFARVFWLAQDVAGDAVVRIDQDGDDFIVALLLLDQLFVGGLLCGTALDQLAARGDGGRFCRGLGAELLLRAAHDGPHRPDAHATPGGDVRHA